MKRDSFLGKHGGAASGTETTPQVIRTGAINPPEGRVIARQDLSCAYPGIDTLRKRHYPQCCQRLFD
jgi:hypothetical protein